MPPNKVDFTGTSPVTSTLPGTLNGTTYASANGAFDESGNLLFYVAARDQDFFTVYDKAGNEVGDLDFYDGGDDENTGYCADYTIPNNEINIVPVPGKCRSFYLIYFLSSAPDGVALVYSEVDCSSNRVIIKTPPVKPHCSVLTYTRRNSFFITQYYGSNVAGLAVSKLRTDHTRFLYCVAYNALDRFIIKREGITFDKTILTSDATHTFESFVFSELKLSHDERKLTFAQYFGGAVFGVTLDNSFNYSSFHSTSAFNNTMNTITGVEFSGNDSKVFISGKGGNTGSLYVWDFSNSVTKIYDTEFAETQLQMASDGYIYCVANNGQSMGRIDPVNNAVSTQVLTITNISLGFSAGNSNTLYTLPDLIDGDDYSPQCTDVYIKDHKNDVGEEPFLTEGDNIFKSPDIWVRPSADGGTVHIDPEYDNTKKPYIYVKLHNRGSTDVTGKVYLHWTFASTHEIWPTHWINYPAVGLKQGDYVVDNSLSNPYIEVTINASSDKTVGMYWDNIPNPDLYTPADGYTKNDFCLLARFVSDDDPISWSPPNGEVTNIKEYVKDNNNVATVNIFVWNSDGKPIPPRYFILRNVKNSIVPLSLRFAIPSDEYNDPFNHHGNINVNLGPELFQHWHNSGELGSGFLIQGDSSFVMTDSVASLSGITMSPNEEHFVSMRFHLSENQSFDSARTFHLDVLQFSDSSDSPDGGLTYEMRVWYGTICGTVFSDLNYNATVDSMEEKLIHWQVFLSGPVNDTIVTDSSGNFRFQHLPPGNYTVQQESQSNWVSTAPISGNYFISLKAGVDIEGKNFGNYHDTKTFRTFKTTDGFATKAVKVTFVKKTGKPKAPPNEATVLEQLFKKVGKVNVPMVGIPRTDSVKQYAWVLLQNDKGKGTDMTTKLFSTAHTGQAYPLDSLRKKTGKAMKMKGIIKPDAKNYNNKAIEQGFLFNLNLLASADSVLPGGLGNLEWGIPAQFVGRNLQGKTLNEIGDLFDSVMTFYKRFGIINDTGYAALGTFVDSVLRRVNDEFAATMETGNYLIDSLAVVKGKNPYAVKLLGVHTASESGFLKPTEKTSTVRSALQQFEQSTRFALNQNYPNPFNPTTTISFLVETHSYVSLRVYDVLGQEVATLINNEQMEAGEHHIEWNASNFPSGIYFYRLNVNNGAFVQTRKLVLMK